MTVIPLFHFTCRHRAVRISDEGMLRPNAQPMLHGRSLVWLTSLPSATAADLGLASQHLVRCDRMEHRFTVSSADAVPWSQYRGGLDPDAVLWLESARGTRPGIWWISEHPLPVIDV